MYVSEARATLGGTISSPLLSTDKAKKQPSRCHELTASRGFENTRLADHELSDYPVRDVELQDRSVQRYFPSVAERGRYLSFHFSGREGNFNSCHR